MIYSGYRDEATDGRKQKTGSIVCRAMVETTCKAGSIAKCIKTSIVDTTIGKSEKVAKKVRCRANMKQMSQESS